MKEALVRLALTQNLAFTSISQADAAVVWVGSCVSQHMRGLHLCISAFA